MENSPPDSGGEFNATSDVCPLRNRWMIRQFTEEEPMTKLRRTLAVCALTLLPLVAFGQAKRPMTINDLITTIRVSDPQVSPDGKRVLFVRTTTALDTGKRNADIWSVPADGSAPSA